MGLFSALEKSDKPKFKKLKEEGCVVTLSVEVPAAKVSEETQNLLVRLQQKAKIPGFRPGKAPLAVVKEQFAGYARGEVLEGLVRKYLPEALRELKLQPVAPPTVEDASFEEGKPAKFSAAVEVTPQVAPKDYLKIPVKKTAYPVAEDALAKRLEELQESNARLEAAPEDAVSKSHFAVIDYAGFRAGKAVSQLKGDSELVDLSSDQTLEGLAEGLIGMKRGEAKELPVKLGGVDTTLKVTVKEIKKKVLPALDADFAKDLGFSSVDELKAKLREVMEQEGKTRTEREVTQQIEEALLKANRIPVPPSLVEAQLEHRIEQLRRQLLGNRGAWPEKQLADLKAKLRPKAEDELRIGYLLPAIAEKEGIKALDEDIQSELDKNLGEAHDDAKKAEVRKFFEERRDAIAGMIRERKTMAFLREKASVKDA